MIIPKVGELYIESTSGLVVECIPQVIPTIPLHSLFCGRIVATGNLAWLHYVGEEMFTLSPSAFEPYVQGVTA